jgi:hydrogenase maturation protease
MMDAKTLILGLGNDILTDDGIGPKLVHDLAKIIDDPDIEFTTRCCGGLEIMEYMEGYEKVIIIDAIRTNNGNPGKVNYFTPPDFRETLNLSNFHDLDFLTALELGNALKLKMPDDLHIIAVEIIEDMEFGEELTVRLQEQYPGILSETHNLIKNIICS